MEATTGTTAAAPAAAKESLGEEIEHVGTEIKDGAEKVIDVFEKGLSLAEKVDKALKIAKADAPELQAEVKTFVAAFETAEPVIATAVTEKGLNLAADSAAFQAFEGLLVAGKALCVAAEQVIGGAIKQVEAA